MQEKVIIIALLLRNPFIPLPHPPTLMRVRLGGSSCTCAVQCKVLLVQEHPGINAFLDSSVLRWNCRHTQEFLLQHRILHPWTKIANESRQQATIIAGGGRLLWREP
jgi:hypothetical protein